MKKLIPDQNCQSSIKLLRHSIPEYVELRNKIECAFFRMTRPQRISRRPRMRIFASNGTRDDFVSRFLSTPAVVDISLREHLEYLWPKGYCVAVNDISCWCQYIHNYVERNFTSHWMNRFGEPVGGIDIYSFVGRYDRTPFGIHKDDEDSYLFNLGPGLKRVFLWEREALINEFGMNALSIPVFHYNSHSAFCKVIELQGGDGLLIPKGIYHILESPEYSVMLGVAPYLGSTSGLINSALGRLCKPIVSKINFINYEEDSIKLELIESELVKAFSSFSEVDISHSIRAEMLLLKSNHHIRGAYVPDNVYFNPQKEYEIITGYAPEKIEILNRLHLFCRGHELSFGNIRKVDDALMEIQCNPRISISLLSDKLSGKLSLSTIAGLLSTLYDCGVIREK